MITYKNYTPHAINIPCEIGTQEIPSVGIARVIEEYRTEDGIPIVEYGEVEGLPDPEPRTLFIVSRVVAERLSHRRDLVFPWSLIRDDKGRVIGCRQFAKAEERVSFPTWLLPQIYAFLAQDSAGDAFAEVLKRLPEWERAA